jgi:hypothetical protein
MSAGAKTLEVPKATLGFLREAFEPKLWAMGFKISGALFYLDEKDGTDIFSPRETQRGRAATKRIIFSPDHAQSQKSPLPPFSERGVGGDFRGWFSNQFCLTKFPDFAR